MKRAMLKWLIVAALCAAAVSAPAPPIHAARLGSVQASACLRGVCLTLIVPRRPYPHDALVQATVVVKNLSREQITGPWRTGGTEEPQVQVLGAHNHVLYPPPFPIPVVNGTFKVGIRQMMLPRAVASEQEFVALLGNRVRAVMHFQPEQLTGGGELTVRTPVIRFSLISAPAPIIALHRSPPVSAVIYPGSPQQRGDLYHVGWYACHMANGQIQFGGSGFYEGPPGPQGIPPIMVGYLYLWVPSSSRVLQPGCSSPLEWHVVAGWPNQPVVGVNIHPRSSFRAMTSSWEQPGTGARPSRGR